MFISQLQELKLSNLHYTEFCYSEKSIFPFYSSSIETEELFAQLVFCCFKEDGFNCRYREISTIGKKLPFFFRCIRHYFLAEHLNHFNMQFQLIHNNLKPPEIRDYATDIIHLKPPTAEVIIGGILGHKVLRSVLDYLPYNYLSFNDFYSFSFLQFLVILVIE